jgi:hypothetical protein
LKSDDEMGEMIGIAIDEFKPSNYNSKLIVLDKKKKINIKGFDSPVLVHMIPNEEVLKEYVEVEGLTVINLTEKL